MTGSLYGMTQASPGASASTNVDLVVKDLNTGTTYSANIYNKSASHIIDTEIVNRNFNNGISVNLNGGHTYVVYLKIEGTAAAYATSEASSDFGPGDGDYEGECVKYSRIYIDF